MHSCSGLCHSRLVCKSNDLLLVFVKGGSTTINPFSFMYRECTKLVQKQAMNFSLLIVGLFGPDMELVLFVSVQCTTKEK